MQKEAKRKTLLLHPPPTDCWKIAPHDIPWAFVFSPAVFSCAATACSESTTFDLFCLLPLPDSLSPEITPTQVKCQYLIPAWSSVLENPGQQFPTYPRGFPVCKTTFFIIIALVYRTLLYRLLNTLLPTCRLKKIQSVGNCLQLSVFS